MSTHVTNNQAEQRYELTIDDQVIGVAEYRQHEDEIDFTHTEINRDHEGRGLGSTLIEAALDDVKRQSFTVIPHCWFVQSHIAEHPDKYLDLVPVERRAQFGLLPPGRSDPRERLGTRSNL